MQSLDVREQPRANVLVFGLSLALAASAAGAVLAQQGWNGSALALQALGRTGEAACLLAFARRRLVRGSSLAWLAAALVLAAALAWLAWRLPPFFGDGQPVATALAWTNSAAFAAAAWLLARPHSRGARRRAGRHHFMAAASVCLAAAELILALLQSLAAPGTAWWMPAQALRVVGYAVLLQAVYISGVRLPYARARHAEARMREGELRLQLLGRNLPGIVLYQQVRESAGTSRFVHMSEAIERLLGLTAQQVMADAQLLFDHILPEDRALSTWALETSWRTRSLAECVVRMRRWDGAIRWVRMSASPRQHASGGTIWDGVLSDVTEQREAERLSRERDEQLASVLEHLPAGIARVDRQGRTLYVNPVQAASLRCAPAALEGQFMRDVLPASIFERMQPPLERALRGDTAVAELSMTGHKTRIDWHVTFVPERVGAGEVTSVVIFAYDVTEQKRLAQALGQQRAQLASLVSTIPDLVSLKDTEGRYLSANPVFERCLGRPEHALVGLTDAQLLPAAEAERVRAQDERAMAAWQPLVVEETLTFAEDGYQGRFETLKTATRDAQGRVSGVLSISRDITDRQRAARQIERLAFYDALTGLPNRRLLLDRLEHALANGLRRQGLGALLFIDLDNFKDLNDTLGHDMGDALLAQVAQRLQAGVRESDTVARLGGDEFVVMLENLGADAQQAGTCVEQIAAKLMAALNEPFVLAQQQHHSTPSVGATLFGQERCTVEELLKRADLAMYQAKAAGRNTLRFFDPAMQLAANERAQLEADLRLALARGELVVHLQPQMDEDTRLCGAEALVRWQHPERGLLGPAHFIPLAEQTGLIVPLGRQVLQAACRQLAHWAGHAAAQGLAISVNVSARQFRHPGFVQDVLQVAAQAGAPLHRLKLELTETLLLGDVEDTVARMRQLREHGVSFSLDDFGTGYSSLGYLKRLPLSEIKIDQGFVRDVLTDPNDAAIVHTILALARSLDLQVVAEGVETEGQLQFLQRHGCGGFQGWLFGRPCAIAPFEAAYLPGLGGPARQHTQQPEIAR
ncbi:GGDEF domain-containing protein [Pulveribacter suum]|uniref:GGDEF domain-containing protein n=2 Tax=Pulveribacter suum TaxID=2116657 RepID=A0A2P1NQ07_9BURK|nr:GGDEF domain-containing protein [Pulveribacter suum]